MRKIVWLFAYVAVLILSLFQKNTDDERHNRTH